MVAHIFIYSYIHIFIYSYIHIFIYSYIIFIYSYIHIFIYSYIHIFIYSYIHIFIYSYIHIFIYSYIHIFHIFIYSYIHIVCRIQSYWIRHLEISRRGASVRHQQRALLLQQLHVSSPLPSSSPLLLSPPPLPLLLEDFLLLHPCTSPIPSSWLTTASTSPTSVIFVCHKSYFIFLHFIFISIYFYI